MQNRSDSHSPFATPPKSSFLFSLARCIARAKSILDRSKTACKAHMSDEAETSSTRVTMLVSPLIATTLAEVSFPFRMTAMIGSEKPSLDPRRRKKRRAAFAVNRIRPIVPEAHEYAELPMICSRRACAVLSSMLRYFRVD
jgi:hypothetical protein